MDYIPCTGTEYYYLIYVEKVKKIEISQKVKIKTQFLDKISDLPSDAKNHIWETTKLSQYEIALFTTIVSIYQSRPSLDVQAASTRLIWGHLWGHPVLYRQLSYGDLHILRNHRRGERAGLQMITAFYFSIGKYD